MKVRILFSQEAYTLTTWVVALNLADFALSDEKKWIFPVKSYEDFINSPRKQKYRSAVRPHFFAASVLT